MPKLVWFRMLKISARNSTNPCSPNSGIAVSFTIEKSQTARSGPRKIPRAESPKDPHVSAALLEHGTIGCKWNMLGLNHWLGFPVTTVSGLYGTKFVAAVYAPPSAFVNTVP